MIVPSSVFSHLYPKTGDSFYVTNVGTYLPMYTVSYPIQSPSSYKPICIVSPSEYETMIQCCLFSTILIHLKSINQPRSLVVRASGYKSRGTGFDSRFYHGDFPCGGRIAVVTMVWVVSRIKFKVETSLTRSHKSINS